MNKTLLASEIPTESTSSPIEKLNILRGGYNMKNELINENTTKLIDECQFGCALEISENIEEKARILQAMLVENLDGTINALVEAYEKPWDYSREVVVDLVSTIKGINTFDFVVEQGDFCDIFRANETLNEVFIVDATEDKYEFIDENFGEDFV
tara:strand:- start:1825 stop:2286 length:462 start_codon:yes stop_codon:yes gene_type:complete